MAFLAFNPCNHDPIIARTRHPSIAGTCRPSEHAVSRRTASGCFEVRYLKQHFRECRKVTVADRFCAGAVVDRSTGEFQDLIKNLLVSRNNAGSRHQVQRIAVK